jgi:hypothetical protein
MIDEDSAGFVEAFTAAVRPGEPRGRPGRWMLLISFAVAFTVGLGALLNGAFGNSGAKSTPTSTSSGTGSLDLLATPPLGAVPAGTARTSATASATGASASATKPGTWTAVGGPGCTNPATGFAESGFYNGTEVPAAAWSTSKTGGYFGDGCAGAFVSMPLSGKADAYDSNRYTVWTFNLGIGTKSESCQLNTYVPAAAALTALGGPAHYYYYGAAYTSTSTATPLGAYAVDQVANRGRWVADDTFTVATGRVSVKLVDAGLNPATAGSAARDAAAQVRLTCSPA